MLGKNPLDQRLCFWSAVALYRRHVEQVGQQSKSVFFLALSRFFFQVEGDVRSDDEMDDEADDQKKSQ